MSNSTADQPKDIQTTVVYTHVLTRGGRGSTAPSTICGKLPPQKAAVLSGLTGRPKTGREVIGNARSRYKERRYRCGSPVAVS